MHRRLCYRIRVRGHAADSKMTMLETLDGGKNWTYGTIPIDGELGQLRISEKASW